MEQTVDLVVDTQAVFLPSVAERKVALIARSQVSRHRFGLMSARAGVKCSLGSGVWALSDFRLLFIAGYAFHRRVFITPHLGPIDLACLGLIYPRASVFIGN